MKYISLGDCKIDMIVAKEVKFIGGEIFLRKGTVLRNEHIGLLKRLEINGIFVEEYTTPGIIAESTIDPLTHSEARVLMKEMFTRASFEKSDNDHLFETMTNTIDDMISQLYESTSETHYISLLKDYDDYTYQHSVDVGILSIMIGRSMNLDRKELFELGKAAFFHDTGKMFIPKEILHKPGRLTEDEFAQMRKHSIQGYEFVKNTLGLGEEVAKAVLYHHEKYDGSGYPFGLSGNQIPLHAQIISVADVYDALNSKRVYKEAMVASEGYEFVMANLGAHFNPEVGQIFLRAVAPFPAGSLVRLSDSRNAVVIKNNRNLMTRPIIRILNENPNNPKLSTQSELIDMAKEPDMVSVTITARI